MLELKKRFDPIDMYDVQGEVENITMLVDILLDWFAEYVDCTDQKEKNEVERSLFLYNAEKYKALTCQIRSELDDLRERARLTDLADTESKK